MNTTQTKNITQLSI